jgi:tetratricopeptide (TPR) repeat protein
LADLRVHQGRTDEAVAAAEKAIALDPSEPYNYRQMAQALIFNGRTADGISYLDAAERVDPRLTFYQIYLRGLGQFCLDRFDDAIASLEKMESMAPDAWAHYFGMYLLVAAHQHLGHPEEAETVRTSLAGMSIKLENANLTLLLARTDFPFKQTADADRLLDSLRKAGVPDLPFSHEWNSPDRLTGQEIKDLVFGHELEGRYRVTNEGWKRRTGINGETEVWSDRRDYPAVGMSWLEGDVLCRWTTNPRLCQVIFRNPEGTSEKRNEYLWLSPFDELDFSQVK